MENTNKKAKSDGKTADVSPVSLEPKVALLESWEAISQAIEKQMCTLVGILPLAIRWERKSFISTLFELLQKIKMSATTAHELAISLSYVPNELENCAVRSSIQVVLNDLANRSAEEESIEIDYDNLAPLDEFEFMGQFDTKGRWMRVHHHSDDPCLSVGLKGAEALGGQNFEGRLLSQIFVQGKVRKFIKHM